MRTRIVLWLLLSLAAPVLAQSDPEAARKAILEDELAGEARLYLQAHAELRDARGRNAADAAERLDRHRRSLAALTREMGRGETEPAKPLVKKSEGGRPEWLIKP